MIYYTRTDSKGRKLITSYANLATAKRIQGMETKSTAGSMWDGEMFFNLDTAKFGKSASGVGLRGYIKCESNDGSGGRFAVFSLVDGKPNDLGLRFKDVGPANTFMKAIAEAYGELFILELEKKGESSASEDEIELSEEAPF